MSSEIILDFSVLWILSQAGERRSEYCKFLKSSTKKSKIFLQEYSSVFQYLYGTLFCQIFSLGEPVCTMNQGQLGSCLVLFGNELQWWRCMADLKHNYLQNIMTFSVCIVCVCVCMHAHTSLHLIIEFMGTNVFWMFVSFSSSVF